MWVIFRALVEALHAMHTGVVPHFSTPQDSLGLIAPGWVPAVNPDIKLENVVFGAARGGSYPAYKSAKMIDSGHVFEEHELVDGDCWRKQKIGTAGVCPPVSQLTQNSAFKADERCRSRSIHPFLDMNTFPLAFTPRSTTSASSYAVSCNSQAKSVSRLRTVATHLTTATAIAWH